MAKWDEITGDCRQEIVFIGQGIDLDILKRQLDACLLTPQEIIAISLELQDLKTTHDELDLYGRIMNYIHQHLTDPDLSIERIARVHYVSTRTVTRAFARYQKSPVAEIWKERLIASREAIERGQVRSISQAALDFGFSDFSHYSHAFRKAFGMAPHTLAPELSMEMFMHRSLFLW